MKSCNYLKIVILLVVLQISFNTAFAQDVVFDNDTFDFGTIAEQYGKVYHTFTFTNNTTAPIVIIKVATSCGCTKAEYDTKPIKPSAVGKIKISYDPLNYQGRVYRRVLVRFSGVKSAVPLNITGHVIPRPKSIEEQFPIVVGKGLRMEANAHTFGFVEHGKSAQSEIEIFNTSTKTITLKIVPQQNNSILKLYYPNSLLSGEKGVISFGYFPNEESNDYGLICSALDIYVDGIKQNSIIHISGNVIDNRDLIVDNAEPICQLSNKIVNFTPQNGDIQKIKITNVGEGRLYIRSAKIEDNIATIVIDKTKIEVGESAIMSIKLNGDVAPQITKIRIITTDPNNPMQLVRVVVQN